MKQNMLIIYASLAAVAVSAVFGLSVRSRNRDFNKTVETALSASVNYDQEFINMVNRLEEELATRASFGYEGGKDPMTGQVRQVVVARPAILTQPAAKKIDDSAGAAAAVSPPIVDSIRLTAIIYDNESKTYTAVVMSGERSFSVGVGDKVSDRIMRSISWDAIVMETDSLVYRYDVTGNLSIRNR